MSTLPATQVQGLLTVHRRGRPAAKNTPVLIMMSGFPDSYHTWDALAAHFDKDYHVITMAYPGVDPDEIDAFQKAHPWGVPKDDVKTHLLALIQDYRDKVGCTTIYLLGHDWGAFPVLKIAHEHPTAITAAVAEDIGALSPLSSIGIKAVAVILGFQSYLASIFLVTRFLPTPVGQWYRQLAVYAYPWSWIGPLFGKVDKFTVTSPYQMYPIFQNFCDAFWRGRPVPFRLTKAPLLFVYGLNKRVLFHSPTYQSKVESRPNCRCIGYRDAGHWVHTAQPERMARDMKDFFQSLGKK